MSYESEVEAVARLMDLAAKYGLEELEVEEGSLKVRLRALELEEGDVPIESGRYTLWPPQGFFSTAGGEGEAPARPPTARPLVAPLTGTFYRASGPEVPSFVEVGSQVQVGDAVGLIEAMKVYSEVPADEAGTVVEIVAQNGKLVQHGEVLMYLDPLVPE